MSQCHTHVKNGRMRFNSRQQSSRVFAFNYDSTLVNCLLYSMGPCHSFLVSPAPPAAPSTQESEGERGGEAEVKAAGPAT